MDNYIEVGQIVNTHGLRGEVKVNPWTDFPEIYSSFDSVFTGDGIEYKIIGVKYQKGCVLLKLDGVSNIDDAQRMRGNTLYVPRVLFDSLPENTYLIADIIGLAVKDADREYGVISDVITTGSNDVYVVKGEDYPQLLIPAIKDVVKEINVEKGYVLVDIPKGLIG